MEYIGELTTVTHMTKPSTKEYVCIKCNRYAEHFATVTRTIKCRYCDFEYEAGGHLVLLTAYNKIQFAEFKETKGTLLKHALKEHKFHFKRTDGIIN